MKETVSLLDVTEKTLRERRQVLLQEMAPQQEELVRIDAVLRLLGGEIPATYRRKTIATACEKTLMAFGDDVIEAQDLADRLGVSRQRSHQLLQRLFHEGRIIKVAHGMYQRPAASVEVLGVVKGGEA